MRVPLGPTPSACRGGACPPPNALTGTSVCGQPLRSPPSTGIAGLRYLHTVLGVPGVLAEVWALSVWKHMAAWYPFLVIWKLIFVSCFALGEELLGKYWPVS